MSAPADRDDQQDAEEQRQPDDRRKEPRGPVGGGMQDQGDAQSNRDREQQQVDDVLERIGHRPLRYPLHLPGVSRPP
jgi:hypothetical protein